MIKTYWKRGDKSEEMDTSSFNGREKQQLSAFIHHEDDLRSFRETAARDASCTHIPGMLASHVGAVLSLKLTSFSPHM